MTTFKIHICQPSLVTILQVIRHKAAWLKPLNLTLGKPPTTHGILFLRFHTAAAAPPPPPAADTVPYNTIPWSGLALSLRFHKCLLEFIFAVCHGLTTCRCVLLKALIMFPGIHNHKQWLLNLYGEYYCSVYSPPIFTFTGR